MQPGRESGASTSGKPWSVAALMLACSLLFAANAQAAIVVNTTADETTPGDGACSLREAVEAAAAPNSPSADCPGATPAGSTIVLPAGTYHLAPADELKVATGTKVAIEGASEQAAQTVIDGDDSEEVGHRGRVLLVGSGAETTLIRVTITGGWTRDGETGTPAFEGSGGPGGAGEGGAGIDNDQGMLTLSQVAVSGNRAGAGGTGGEGQFPSPPSFIEYPGGPGGPGGGGGGILNEGALTLLDSTVSGNQAGGGGEGGFSLLFPGAPGAGGSGGGIYDEGKATLVNDTIAQNTAGAGGPGQGVVAANGGAAGGGGGIEYAGGAMSLLAVTLAGNAVGAPGAPAAGGQPGLSAFGGAIEAVGKNITETSTLIAGNSRPACTGTIADGGYDLGYPAFDESCPHDVAANPLLGPLADDGGATQTLALTPGSAAIDQVPVGLACPATDQRGIARPQPAGGLCDIGAFEYMAPAAAPAGNPTPSSSSPSPPVLSGLRIQPHTFPDTPGRRRHGRRRATGASVSYTDTQAVTTTFTVLAARPGVRADGDRCVAPPKRRAHSRSHLHKCTRYVALHSLRHQDVAGANRFHFAAVFDGRPLPPGRYRLQAVAAPAPPIVCVRAPCGGMASAGFRVTR